MSATARKAEDGWSVILTINGVETLISNEDAIELYCALENAAGIDTTVYPSDEPY